MSTPDLPFNLTKISGLASEDFISFFALLQQNAVAILITFVAAFMIYYWLNLLSFFARCNRTPYVSRPAEGPALPFIGHALQFMNHRPWDLLMNWHSRYGPLIAFPLLGEQIFSVASPELAKLVLQSKIKSIQKDIANTMKHFLVILGTGIVTSEGESWFQQRLKMSHPLRRDVLEMIPSQTLQAVQRLFETMDEAAQTGEAVPMGSSLRHLTLQVISGVFLSLSADESDSTFAKMYLPIVDEANKRVWHPYRAYLFFLPFFWKHIIYVRRLNRYVSKLIVTRWQDRLAGVRKDDILDKMLDVYEKEKGLTPSLHPEIVRQLRDELKTFMLAGHETSAAMMTWAIYELMGNAKLMKEVTVEGSKIFDPKKDWRKASTSDIPEQEKLTQLVLSEACLRESLRKYSVVPIVARRTKEDVELDGYFIPKGSSTMINIQAIHLNEKYWPEPLKFDPSRFMGKEIEPFTFLAFIAGPRNCLGQHLALLESKMVISLLASRYTFRMPDGESVEVGDWKDGKDPRHHFMIPLIPKNELMVHVERK